MILSNQDHSLTALVDGLFVDTSIATLEQAQLELAIQHGVAPLLYARLDRIVLSKQRQNEALDAGTHSQNNEIELQLKRLKRAALVSEATSMVRQAALEELVPAAHARGISMLLMKGVALAYQVYATPGHRPSSDIDIFIDETKSTDLQALLSELGYAVNAPLEKSMISFQYSALKNTNTGHTLVLDIHCRINNQTQYARHFDFPTVLQHSTLVPQIHQQARALGIAHAYVFACVHLQGHLLQGEPIKAIWLYDIHLLVQVMSAEEREQVIVMLQSGAINADDLGAVCSWWTEQVTSCFGTALPADLRACLDDYADKVDKPRINPLKLLWNQLRYLPDNRARARFIKQLFIPTKDRIREKYPASTLWLPLLYVRRALSGFWARLVKIRH